MDVALICERLHVLPNEGGVFQQASMHVRKLLVVFDQLDTFRNEELQKASAPEPQHHAQPAGR